MRNTILARAFLALACAVMLLTVTASAQQLSPKSPEEAKAVMALFNAQDADTRIAAANELLEKYADTDFKAIALQFAAASYQQKNDYENMIIYAERAVEADPKSYMSLLMLANGIAQRTREFDLDREEKLARVEKYVASAEEVLASIPKPNPNLTDEEWEAAKRDFSSQGHEALAMSAMARKDHAKAIEEFKLTLENAQVQEPATMVRLAAVYAESAKYDESIATLDKVLATPNLHPQIKTIAEAEKARAAEMKAKGVKASGPASSGPAQVEINIP